MAQDDSKAPEGNELTLGRFEYCLDVKDVRASLEFYLKLGFVKTQGEPDEGWAIVKNGGCILGLYEGHIGKNILNFRGADVFALAEELKSRSVELTEGPLTEPDGSAAATLHDPDGNEIYLNTAPGEEI